MRVALRHVVWMMTVMTVACARDDTPSGDTTAASDSASTPASASDIARPAGAQPGAASRPAAGEPTPVAGRPACDRPVTVTYYARGGVPDEFIVTFGAMNGAPADSVIDALARKHSFTATHRYQGAFSGFSARLPLAKLEAIRCEPVVTRISQVVVGGIGPPASTPPPAPTA